MKTIKEAEREYTNSRTSYIFQAGVDFAQRWISVEDELPEIKENPYQVLIKYGDEIVQDFWVRMKGYCTNGDNLDFFKRHNVTHWRPIELK